MLRELMGKGSGAEVLIENLFKAVLSCITVPGGD